MIFELVFFLCGVHYMTDSRDRGISQPAFDNPIRTASYGLPHTDCFIRTDISSQQTYYGPDVFIENKALKNRSKMLPNEVLIDENIKIDDLQSGENGGDSPSFDKQTSSAQFL